MILLIGLGNTGEKYEKTRHNFGFLAVDKLRECYGGTEWKYEKKFLGKVSVGRWKDEKVVFLKPDTYMNLSGRSVGALMRFYKIPVQNVAVFFDDLDLPFGAVRFRASGGSGGHNGIKSLFQGIGSQDFSRIKFGIANDQKSKMPVSAFVLQRFSTEEQKKIPGILEEGRTLFEKNFSGES